MSLLPRTTLHSESEQLPHSPDLNVLDFPIWCVAGESPLMPKANLNVLRPSIAGEWVQLTAEFI